jgi:ubiquitin carboxyl-terminal hydrolase 5/13
LQHYEDTGRRYPLCAKLGTITASGADVWSYAADEDCMVLDPELARHLSHWGIDVMQLQRTDKSLIEMELEANLKFDWSKIVDGDETLTPVSGPGLKGLKNLGSSCYMNSVLQCFAAMPELQSRYKDIPIATLVSVPSPEADLGVQISKLLRALYSDRYAEEAPGSLPYTPEKYTLTPTMLKAIVGRGHREFGGSRQQDASEFFQHFLELLTRYEREGLQRLGLTGPRTARLFQFELEECLRSEATGQVRYRSGAQTLQTLLELRIPLTGTADEDGKDNDTEQDAKKARVEEVSFQSCVADYFRGSTVEFRHPNPVVGADKGQQWLRMKTFPKYLMMKLGRYYVDSAWRQVKVGAKVAVPELLDLREMRASGLQPGETPMEEAADTSVPKADAGVVAQLMSMGFSENGSTRAALACGGDPEAAVAWVFEHIEVSE